MSRAEIADPEVLRAFRLRLSGFLRDTQTGLGGVVAQYYAVEERLRGELQSHWKSQLRRREEVYNIARLKYLAAKDEVDAARRGRGGGKQSCDDERLDMQRAQRKRDEAEEKLAHIARWLHRLHQDGEPLVGRCRNHDLGLGDLGDKALRALDTMAKNLDAYHAVRLPPSSAPTTAPGGT